MNDLTDIQLKEFFEKPLPSKLPKASEKFWFEHDGTVTELKVLPIQVKPKKETDPLKLLKPITEGDDLRPVLNGVFHDAENQCLVATNTHSLFVMDYEVKGESRIIDPRPVVKWEGTVLTEEIVEIDGRFPNYMAVIPEVGETTIVEVQPILSELAGLSRANKFISGFQDKIYAKIVNGDVDVFFNPMMLYDLLLVFARLGFDHVGVYHSGDPTQCIVITGEGCKGILMPVMYETGYVHEYKTILTL